MTAGRTVNDGTRAWSGSSLNVIALLKLNHQNPLQDLLKHRDLTPKVLGSVGSGGAQKLAFLLLSPVIH